MTELNKGANQNAVVESRIDYQDRRINDFIEQEPNWILRSGITMIAIVVAVLLTLANFISYPDKITASGIISTVNPPIAHVTQTKSIIEDILVENGVYVSKDQELIYFKNTAQKDDVNAFLRFIDQFESSNEQTIVSKISPPEGLNVGNMQSLYASFILKYKQFRQEILSSNVAAKIDALNYEINNTLELIAVQNNEKDLFKTELDISVKNMKRNQLLFEQGVLSEMDNEQVIVKATQMRRQYENMEIGIIQNKIKLAQLQYELAKLQEERDNQKRNYSFEINEVITRVKEAYAQWKAKNIISSESDGIFTYPFNIKKGTHIDPGSIIGYTISQDTNDQKLLTATTGPLGLSKLTVGNKAIIKIDAYPYKEYGVIVASISSISSLPLVYSDSESKYEIQVLLSDDLLSDYGMIIEFSPNMTATVEFITEDKTILERIMSQFLDLIKH